MESERDLPILISQKSEKDILLAILTKLTATEKTRLGEYFQKLLPDDARIITWTPTQAVLLSLTKQKSRRDSQANLYALGVLLHRLGLSNFLVADELTKRQLTGKCRLGENSEIYIRGFHFRRVPGRYAHVLKNGINTGRQAVLDVALPEWECFERPGWPVSDDFRCQLTRQ